MEEMEQLHSTPMTHHILPNLTLLSSTTGSCITFDKGLSFQAQYKRFITTESPLNLRLICRQVMRSETQTI